MNDDAELLRAYVRDGSEPAFRELVGHHLPLVQATARRIVAGDTHLAQDVAQTVFTDLARKAGTLPPGLVLGGWLHRHTCFTAAKAVRAEQRRRARERTAMEINAINDDSARDEHWRQLAPVIDDALNHLSGEDRDAIILRYFEQCDLRAIGATLGLSDDTAQKRISRALDKLRAILTRRGVTVSAALLASTLDAGATVAPVSTGLAASISTNALVGASAVTSTSILLPTLKTMITSKLALGVAAFAVGVITTVLVTQKAAPAAPAPTTARARAAEKPAAVPVAQISANQVEAPKVAPAPARDAVVDTSQFSQSGSNQPVSVSEFTPSNFQNLQPGTVFVNPPQTVTMMTTRMGTSGDADPFSSNTGTVMISTTTGGTTQVSDNGDGTMTLTLPDGTTQTIPKPQTPVNSADNGDGTMTMTMPDGSTRTLKVGTISTAGDSGVVIQSAP